MKNKKVLFNAMVCCDVDIESMDQLKISFQEKKAKSALTEQPHAKHARETK